MAGDLQHGGELSMPAALFDRPGVRGLNGLPPGVGNAGDGNQDRDNRYYE